jgi:hypothetical protein
VWSGEKESIKNMPTIVWDLLLAVNGADLVDCLNAGREATVDAENPTIDHRRQAQTIEHFGAAAPE